MKKAFITLAAVSALALGMVSASAPAEARCNWGCGVAIGAGAVLGAAVIGNTIAATTPPPGYAWNGYAPVSGYVTYAGYDDPSPVGCPGGYWARRPLYNQWGNQIGWSRPRFFCPY